MSDLEVREQLDSRELDQLLQELENTDSETQLGLIVFKQNNYSCIKFSLS